MPKINITKLIHENREKYRSVYDADNPENWLEIAILSFVSQNYKELLKAPEGDTIFDIVTTVDGIEVDLTKFIERIYKSYHESVNKSAQKLIKEKIADRWNTISNILEAAERELSDLNFIEEEDFNKSIILSKFKDKYIK